MSKILSYFSIKTMVISAVVTLSGRPLSKTRKSSSCFLTYVEVFGNLEGWFFPWFYFKIMSKNFEESFLNIFHLLIACTDSYSNIFFFSLRELSVFKTSSAMVICSNICLLSCFTFCKKVFGFNFLRNLFYDNWCLWHHYMYVFFKTMYLWCNFLITESNISL